MATHNKSLSGCVRAVPITHNSYFVVLNDGVARASMEVFAAFIRHDPFIVTHQNYQDLRLLACSLKVAELATILGEFMRNSKNAKQIVIPSILFGDAQDLETSSKKKTKNRFFRPFCLISGMIHNF
jgi:hypothetical protein